MIASTFSFSVPGEPQGKGRARVGRVGGHARMFTPAKTAAYEGLVAMAAAQAFGDCGPLCCSLSIEITAVHAIPASWSKKKRHEAETGLRRPATKPDADNIAKAICDGGNGVAWTDDKLIADLHVRRIYGSQPAVHVKVEVLPCHA